jgi:hypothetical protein
MKGLNVKPLGEFRAGGGTFAQWDREVEECVVERRIGELGEGLEGLCDEYVCYVFGMGAKSKSVYRKLKGAPGLHLAWHRTVLFGTSKWLGSLVHSQAGLVRVNDATLLRDLFFELADHSMAGVYIFSASREARFVESLYENPTPGDFLVGLGGVNDYLVYVVDADNYESSTGIYEIVSIGKNSPVHVNWE